MNPLILKNLNILSEDDLNGHTYNLKTNSEELFAIADSRSPISFLNKDTARRIQQNDKSALYKRIPPDDTAKNLAHYNGETFNPKGRLIITIESGGWRIQSARFIFVDDQKTNIIGRNILPQIGVKLIQEKQKQNVLSVREQEESDPETKQWVKENFPQLCIRIGKSKNQMMRTEISNTTERSTYHGTFTGTSRRGTKQTNRSKHIVKLDKYSDRQFISPFVFTVKKDQTVKLVLDSKKINKFIHKNKYQMPNIDRLLHNIAQVLKSDKSKQMLFSTLDLR